MKTCTRCLSAKEDTEFYANRYTKDGLHSWCKTCQAAERKNAKHGITKSPSTKQIQGILAQHGIPSFPGSGSAMPWVDLVAWSCVPIEAKTSKWVGTKGEVFCWKYSRWDINKWPEGLFVFVANRKNGTARTFVIPVGESILRYKPNGEFRTAISLSFADRHRAEDAIAIQNLFLSYENRFDLIEEYRILASRELMRSGEKL